KVVRVSVLDQLAADFVAGDTAGHVVAVAIAPFPGRVERQSDRHATARTGLDDGGKSALGSHGPLPSFGSAPRMRGLNHMGVTMVCDMANETIFTMDASSIKFGPGATREVGDDLRMLGASRVMVVTDPRLAKLEPVAVALESLRKAGIDAV